MRSQVSQKRIGKAQLRALGAVKSLANDIAGEDETMKGSELLKNYHYTNAINLVRYHLDPSYDIRWLEDAYPHWQRRIEELLG